MKKYILALTVMLAVVTAVGCTGSNTVKNIEAKCKKLHNEKEILHE